MSDVYHVPNINSEVQVTSTHSFAISFRASHIIGHYQMLTSRTAQERTARGCVGLATPETRIVCSDKETQNYQNGG